MIRLSSWARDRLFYGWVVVIAFFVMIVVVVGVRFSFGIFFKSLAGDFGLTRAETSGVFSVFMLWAAVSTMAGGWSSDRFSPKILISVMGALTGLSLILTSRANAYWQLFVFYGFLLAMGNGGAYVVSTAVISRWFRRKRGLAIGLCTSGSGVGTATMAPFATYLVTSSGWRTAMIVIGILGGVLMISVAMVLKKDPGDLGLWPDGVKPDGKEARRPGIAAPAASPGAFSLVQAMGTRNFWCLGFSTLLFSLCLHLVLTHIVAHGTDAGVSAMKAAGILGLIGAMSIPGRLLAGRVSDSLSRKTVCLVCALIFLMAIAWLMRADELWMFYLFAVVFGFSFGGLDTTITAFAGDLFGLRSIGAILGALSVGWCLGASVGPAMGGFVYDRRGSYSAAFLICVLCMMIVILLLIFSRGGKKDALPEGGSFRPPG